MVEDMQLKYSLSHTLSLTLSHSLFFVFFRFFVVFSSFFKNRISFKMKNYSLIFQLQFLSWSIKCRRPPLSKHNFRLVIFLIPVQGFVISFQLIIVNNLFNDNCENISSIRVSHLNCN